MVSLGTIGTLAALAGLAVAVLSFGGFSGIGSKIGTGIRTSAADFFSSLTGGLVGKATAAGANVLGGEDDSAEVLEADTTLTNISPDLGPDLLIDSFQQTKSTLDDINNFFRNLVSGSLFNPNAFSTASSFTPEAIAARIARQEVTAAQIAAGTIGGTQFGGFANAATQEAALQAAIVASKEAFPSFFK